MKDIYWPKKTKYKKFQKSNYRLKGLASGLFYYNDFYQGFFFKLMQSKKLKTMQIESARRVIRRLLKNLFYIRIFINCDQSLTQKSSGVRMGKGKGSVYDWVCNINSGRLLFYIYHLNYFQAYYVFLKAKKKISIKSSFKF
jgi:large subunit ribosomal protein L16